MPDDPKAPAPPGPTTPFPAPDDSYAAVPYGEMPPAETPPDSVHGVSIDLGPAPPAVEVAPRPTPPSKRPAPNIPARGKPFDPRLIVPLDLLDPSLPSARDLDQRNRQDRARLLRMGLLIGGGILTGIVVSVVAVVMLRQRGLEPLPAELDVGFEVQTSPPGAEIFIDGKTTALLTPAQLKGWDFTSDHQISVELRGYYPQHRTVVSGLHPPDLNIQLPLLAHLSASTQPIPAGVLLDGEVVGTTPADIDVPADRDLKLTLRAAGFVPLHREIRLKPDELMHLDVTLDPLALVTIKSTPPGAKISVDGAPPVLAPTELEISAGLPHRIEARVPGVATQVRMLKIAPGKTEHLDLRFEDARNRSARAELSRVHAREAADRRKLKRAEARGGDEYVGNARKLNDENALNDDLDRLETREQELEDEIADHDQELEDRIKAENVEATAKPAPRKPTEAAQAAQAE